MNSNQDKQLTDGITKLATNNMKQQPNKRNESWGASINNLPPTTFRIYFQNINGLQVQMSQNKWKAHLDFMKEKGIAMTRFAKTNTNWNFKNIKKQISATAQSVFEFSSVAFSENRFNPPSRSPYLPGGCLQLCTDHWMGRITVIIKDPRRMGRWTGNTFRFKEWKTSTAYRPCQQSIGDTKKLSTTVTYQQKLLIRKEKGKDGDPRSLFMTDLIKEIQDIEKNPNNYDILMWDANESIHDKAGNIRKLISKTRLVDTFSMISGNRTLTNLH
jgi:hypothetical protein